MPDMTIQNSAAIGSDEVRHLCQVSAMLGKDPLLVQAAGGNTSIKLGDTMWIKASGTWLSQAEEQPIMVPVDRQALLQAVIDNDPAADQAIQFVPVDSNPDKLRPSIETTVHAVFEQPVVLHVHCVDTISLAVQRNTEALLAERLKEFDWACVPYVKPGLTLAQTIRAVLTPTTNVVVLGNHGLVVAADSVEATHRLLNQVCAALQQPAREAPPANLERLHALCDASIDDIPEYKLPVAPQTHDTATDSLSCTIAGGGSLYPDHVIFLGHGVTVAGENESIADVCRRVARLSEAGLMTTAPVLILFPRLGAVMRTDATPAQHAMARCLADVCRRVPDSSNVQYLEVEEAAALLDWDAEKYRQKIKQPT